MAGSVALLLASLCGADSHVSAARAGEQSSSTGQVAEVALAIGELVHHAEQDSKCDVRALADQVATLGPSVIPAVLEILACKELPTNEGALPLTTSRGSLLLGTLAAQPRATVLDVVREQAHGDISDGHRVALLLVVGWMGESTPQLWLEAAGGLGEEHEVTPRVGEAFERTLATALTRAPKTAAQWESLPDELSDSLISPLARALGRSGRSEGQAALEKLLQSRPEAAAIVLAELRAFLVRAPHLRFPEILELVRSFLVSDLEAARLEAAQICGLVGDAAVVPDLIQLLDHPSVQLQEVAGDALARLSGQRLLRGRPAWQRWHALEEAWFEREGRARMSGLALLPAQDFLPELRGLLEHRIFRRELGLALSPCLERREEGIVITVCAALAELHAPGVDERIAAMINHPNTAIRRAARQTWTAIHGQAQARSE